MNPLISIVSPVYKAESIVPELVRRMTESVKQITESYEIILVCDGSPDASWARIKEECAKNSNVVGINLSKNFGQHYALTAGLRQTKGDWVIIMDCDLQDQPEEMVKLWEKTKEGYEVVHGQRVERKDGSMKKLSSTLFAKTFRWISDIEIDHTVSNFGIYNRKVIDVFNALPEEGRDCTVLLSSLGFNSICIPVEHAERASGKSSYTLGALLKLAFGVMLTNSNKPLRLSVYVGFGMAVVSLLLALYNFIAGAVGYVTVEGYTSTVFSIWFIGGLMLAQGGMLGVYIGKIFNQVKGRPLYIIQEIVNGK